MPITTQKIMKQFLKARFWYERAAEQGISEAKSALEHLCNEAANALLAEEEARGADAEKGKKNKKKKKKGRQSSTSTVISEEEKEEEVHGEESMVADLSSLSVCSDASSSDRDARLVAESSLGGASTCTVCFTYEKTHLCVPCGHQCACETCSKQLSSCPICRQTVNCWVKVHVA